jgi:hypothetical protein
MNIFLNFLWGGRLARPDYAISMWKSLQVFMFSGKRVNLSPHLPLGELKIKNVKFKIFNF